MSNAIENLPPEMQARLAAIMAGQQQESNAPAAPTPPAPVAAPNQQAAPVTRPPSLMDHVIALRQEVAVLRQQVAANSDVVEAVGQAVGQLYQMFQQTPQTHAPSQTFGENFQQSDQDF
nr:hypothetical protein 14 [Paracoccaceae bacterium]